MERPNKKTPATIKGSYINLGNNMSFNWEQYANDLDTYIDFLEERLSERQVTTEVSDNAETKVLSIADVSNRRELLIAFGKKVQEDVFKSDKPRTVEDSYEEFKSNL